MEAATIYKVTISNSEPQIVDMKKVYYTHNLMVKSPRVESSPSRKFIKKKSSLESVLTEKMKQRESFDNIYEVLVKSRRSQTAEA
jgi:hypothetical protein